MQNNFSKLEDKLGYFFKDKGLLQLALSHRSVKSGVSSNERLEFIGDATLNFIIAVELYAKYPLVEEGSLSRFRANLVNGEVLARLALEFLLSDFILLGTGERKSGGNKRESILADAMEAIIGAIYLDSNIEVTKKIVLQWYQQIWPEILSAEPKDPKTRLQEYMQAKGMPLPQYQVVKIEGSAHLQVFQISCEVPGLALKTIGVGHNKRKAEQDAAAQYLLIIK